MSRHLAVAAVLAALLAGCSDDPEPQIADPTSDPPTSSAPPESSPPTSPPTQDPEPLSPEETVTAWVAARNELVQTGDPSTVEALSSPDCDTCSDSISPVVDVYQDGGHYETTGWKVKKPTRDEAFPTTREVVCGLVYAAGRTVLRAGAEPTVYDEERHLAVFTLRRVGDMWLVERLVYLS